jgi:hypothetical protein
MMVGVVGAVLAASMGVVVPQEAKLSEVEALKVQVLQLRVQLANVQAEADACRGVLGQYRVAKASEDLTAEEQQLKAAIEKAHPGFEWNPRTGALVKRPDEKK